MIISNNNVILLRGLGIFLEPVQPAKYIKSVVNRAKHYNLSAFSFISVVNSVVIEEIYYTYFALSFVKTLLLLLRSPCVTEPSKNDSVQ